jgi:YtkA-like
VKPHLLWWAFALLPWHLACAEHPPQMALRCQSTGDEPRLQCVVSLRDAKGNPVTGAKLVLRAHMPSMPMAHSVRPAAASSTAYAGEYEAALQLEMPGLWAVQIDLSQPKRHRWIQPLRANRCDKPCAAPLIHTKKNSE